MLNVCIKNLLYKNLTVQTYHILLYLKKVNYSNNVTFPNSNKPSNQEMSLINDQGELINMIESRYQL